MKRDVIPENLSRVFYEYGKVVAMCPWPFIVAPIFCTLALGSGFWFMVTTSDMEYLYVPLQAPSKLERYNMESTFLFDDNEYYSSVRRTRFEGMTRILIQDKNRGNVFTDTHLAELYRLDAFVKNFTIQHGAESLRYDDVCAHWKGSCADVENTFMNSMRGLSLQYVPVQYPVYETPAAPILLTHQVGSPEVNQQGIIISAKAFAISYSVRYDLNNTYHQERSTAWAKKLTDEILNYQSDFIDVNIETYKTIETELEKIILEVVPMFAVTFIVLGSFAFLSLLMSDWVRGKPYVASAGMIAAMMGSLSGQGFLLLCGVKFTSAIGAMPFLIIGIGMDDMYIMVSSWRCSSYALPVEERCGRMLKHSAVSITITSITDALAFGIGMITPFRTVQLFCAYTMVGVIFCYFYQLTFTVACMAYDGRREDANRHCITFRKIPPASEASKKSRCYISCCTGGEPHSEIVDRSKENMQQLESTKIKLPFLNKIMGNEFAEFLMKTPVKIIVILVYAVYLGFAIYGITLMKEGLEQAKLVPDTSYFHRFYKDYQQHFGTKFGPAIIIAYDEPLNYTDQSVRDELAYDILRFKHNEYFNDDDNAVISWLDNFEQYLALTSRDISELNEEEFIRILRLEFLNVPGFDYHISDIDFDSTNTSIRASRIFIQCRGLKDAKEEQGMMASARSIAEQSSYETFTYHISYLYIDQYAVVARTTLQNLSIATISMLLVAIIFIPSIVTVLWVTFTTVSIEIGVMGYMVFMDVNLDSISMINLIMCIGFSVDFAAHISYHYAISKASNATECAKEALGHLGTPIIQAALSTILGVVILSISTSYIFRTFFKLVTLVMAFGSFHALFLLPVILSTIKSYSDKRSTRSDLEVADGAVEMIGATPIQNGQCYKDRQSCENHEDCKEAITYLLPKDA